ncbi:MAG: hypothetical protein AAF402_04745 [Pseudomonadota bacterium]
MTKFLSVALVFCFAAPSALADIRLIDKTFSLSWSIHSAPDERTFDSVELYFCSELELIWNELLDKKSMANGQTTYELTEIEPGILRITWKQSKSDPNRIVVTTLNLFKWSAYGVIVAEGDAEFTAGAFSFNDGIKLTGVEGTCITN